MRTLRQALSECTDAQLEQIMHLWGMDGEKHDNPRFVYDTLLKRAKDPIAARFVWEYLPDKERQLLFRVLMPASRYSIQRYALQKKLGLSDEEHQAMLERLASSLLIQARTLAIRTATGNNKGISTKEVETMHGFSEHAETLYEAGREFFKVNPEITRLSLAKLLAPLDENALHLIMGSYRLRWDILYLRSDLRTTIIDNLLALQNPLSALAHPNPQASRLFMWLIDQGSHATMQEVRQQTGASDAALLQILHTLSQSALAFDTFINQERVLFIPQDLYEALKDPKPGQQSTILTALVEPPPSIEAAETTTLYDLAVLIGTIYQQSIEPTQSGPMNKRLASKLRPLLRGQARTNYAHDDTYMGMLIRIAQDLHLVKLSEPLIKGLKAHYEPGAYLEEWSKLDSIGQIQQLLLEWTTRPYWEDIFGADFRAWNPYGYHDGILEGRLTLLKHLKECAPGSWYSIEALLHRIWEEDPFVMRPTRPYTRTIDRTKNRQTHASWLNSEGQAYTGMLTSSLSEFGIVSVGRRQSSSNQGYCNPDAFMLTEIGETVLLKNETEASTPGTNSPSNTLVVQPNFELLLLQPDLPTLYSLLPFAQASQIGLVSRFTITRASLLRGLEVCQDVEQIIETLETYSQKELPQNVIYSLNDWARNYRETRITQVLLFQVSSEATATQLLSLKGLKEAGLRQIAPCTLIVETGTIELQEIKRLLDKEGVIIHISRTAARPSRTL